LKLNIISSVVISFDAISGLSFGLLNFCRVKEGALTKDLRIPRLALVKLIMYLGLVLLVDLIGLLAADGSGNQYCELVL
jgi:hypothetical protein